VSADGQAEKVPTYAVRFESHDDFLVEYADRLSHGFAMLPLAEPLPHGTGVRLRVHLPDESVLYLVGSTLAPTAADRTLDPSSTRVKLSPLTPEQRDTLQQCVEGLLGRGAGDVDASTQALGSTRDEEGELTVLLVDDSVSQRIELGDALRARGLRVRVADHGLAALSAAIKRPPDVILTDVEMPHMDGWMLLRSVRQRPALAHVAVVFLTRLGDDASRLRGYRMGVDDYLPKTMSPDEILARLQGVIERRRQFGAERGVHGLRGDLEHVRLGSLLAFLESERRSGALHLERGVEQATLHIRQGAIVEVENLGHYQHTIDRVFDLLGWVHGRFELVAQLDNEVTAADRDPISISYLLLEHARRTDESGR
jgi:DNA-binding response OmpR family regulator